MASKHSRQFSRSALIAASPLSRTPAARSMRTTGVRPWSAAAERAAWVGAAPRSSRSRTTGAELACIAARTNGVLPNPEDAFGLAPASRRTRTTSLCSTPQMSAVAPA